MKNPFRKDTASALMAAQEDVAATEAKIAELQSERQLSLLSDDIGAISALDAKISDQFRALKVHQDRVVALQAQLRREHLEQLELLEEREAAFAAWQENLPRPSYQLLHTGKINKITLTIDRPQLSPDDIKKLQQAQRNNKVSE